MLSQHRFGFALVMSDLGLELGQLAIVLVLAPVADLLRETFFYRRIFMPGGAVAIASVASYWFVIRAFDLSGDRIFAPL
jgi:hypothetical protein